MDKATAVLLTLLAYKALLIGIGLWAARRSNSEADFFLGGRGLGPVVAAISYSASASSAWTLLGISGLAYAIGVSAVWVALGSILGAVIAWVWIAPRLLDFSAEHGCLTLTDFLLHQTDGRARVWLRWSASLIILVSFLFYVAAQFQGAGTTFATTFGLGAEQSIVLGALIIGVYTLLGGFWAVSVTDTVQGLLMAFTALLLPSVAVFELGGPVGFVLQLQAVSTPAQLSLSAGNGGLVAAGVVIGGLLVGIGTYGQPHLLVRFMALRDQRARRQAMWMSLCWYAVVFLGMCVVGLAGHVLHAGLANPETVFFVLLDSLFPSLLGAVLLAAVLSAIMSTADSQLLVAASTLAHDLGLARRRALSVVLVSRLTIIALVCAAVTVAIALPQAIFSRVLFAWIALGSAFGPLVFARLGGRTIAGEAALCSVLTGFSSAVLLSWLPDTPGDIAERVLPFTLAAMVLLLWPRPRPCGSSQLSADRPAAGSVPR